MEIIEKRLEDIRPYENNPRVNDAAVPAVAESLKKFGWQQPLVIDRNNVIVCGHTRYKAAISLGMTTAPCKYADELTDEEITAYRLADNKTAELAEWDADKMAEELSKCSELDMSAFGFDLSNLMEDEDIQIVDDEYDAEVPGTPRTKRGDIYVLGRHKLMCGDALRSDDVKTLLGGGATGYIVHQPAVQRRLRKEYNERQRTVEVSERRRQQNTRRVQTVY